jgi:hypothetical protein
VAGAIISIFTLLGYGIVHFALCSNHKLVAIICHLVGGILIATLYTVSTSRKKLEDENKDTNDNDKKTD